MTKAHEKAFRARIAQSISKILEKTEQPTSLNETRELWFSAFEVGHDTLGLEGGVLLVAQEDTKTGKLVWKPDWQRRLADNEKKTIGGG